MSFHKQTFANRYAKMGDEAEAKFEELWTRPDGKPNYHRIGIDRPAFSIIKLPQKIRQIPDYLTGTGFVEVMGCGSDGTLKLKVDKLEALEWWDEIYGVWLFIWHTTTSRAGIWPIADMAAVAATTATKHFTDGKQKKPYYPIPLDALAGGWLDA